MRSQKEAVPVKSYVPAYDFAVCKAGEKIGHINLRIASRRVCEKLGARFLRLARLPAWHELYQEDQRSVNIFEWDIEA